MKIAIVATHSFPIPYLPTGDIVILQLANVLGDMGHDVSLIAPAGTQTNGNVKLLEMKASYGKYPPSSQECENEAYLKHRFVIDQCDIVHDFSNSKWIVKNLAESVKKTISTIMGGPWTQNEFTPPNIVGWSQSHVDRIIRGATDYEGTPTPDLAGHTGRPVKNARVVNGGVDTKIYEATYNKKNYILWMGRWSKVRGYLQAIEIAKTNPNTQFIFSGVNPDNEYFAQEKACANEAVELASKVPNIKIQLLPLDPAEHLKNKIKLYQEARGFLYNVQFCEPFGLMQAEALACGTPVIGTNYGSVSEVIQDGVTGYVRENNISTLSEAISMIDNIDPKTCRERAVHRFDIKVMAQNYLTEYQNIINGNGW